MSATRTPGIFSRLYRGETAIDFIGPRKRWYLVSVLMLALCIGFMGIKGFNFGIEFAGGNQFVLPKAEGVTLEEVRGAAEQAGAEISSAQEAGRAAQTKFVLKTGELTGEQQTNVREALAESGKVAPNDVAVSEVSSSWGTDVTEQALIGLLVFLVLLSIYLWIRFESKMAFAALFALIHDLLLTAGVYAMVGFEVTPATVVGILTILGYSLYDTVVVFDKVQENTRGILGGSRHTYAEAANLAVNQTLMRSINTSLIGLLPVAGLLFVGAGVLGVGTLKDLALVLFVGMITGAYSSLFLATPWLVDMKITEPRYRNHTQRVLAKRRGEDTTTKTGRAARAAKRKSAKDDDETDEEDEPATTSARASRRGKTRRDADSDVDDIDDELDDVDDVDDETDDDDEPALAGSAPRPGARAGVRGGQRKRGGTAKGNRPRSKRKR